MSQNKDPIECVQIRSSLFDMLTSRSQANYVLVTYDSCNGVVCFHSTLPGKLSDVANQFLLSLGTHLLCIKMKLWASSDPARVFHPHRNVQQIKF